jgi:DNA replicative helicase MCM subunit Mcm2 (Cdc46/Mcm family)
MRYYQLQRQSDERQSARTTVRLLESLVRLSEAHAKVMMRTEVGIEDAVSAIACVSLSQMSATSSTSLLGSGSGSGAVEGSQRLGDAFLSEYVQQEEALFRKLRLTRASLCELCRADAKEFAATIASGDAARQEEVVEEAPKGVQEEEVEVEENAVEEEKEKGKSSSMVERPPDSSHRRQPARSASEPSVTATTTHIVNSEEAPPKRRKIFNDAISLSEADLDDW